MDFSGGSGQGLDLGDTSKLAVTLPPTVVAPHWCGFSTDGLNGITKRSCQNHLLNSYHFESVLTFSVDRCNEHVPTLASRPLVNRNCTQFRW